MEVLPINITKNKIAGGALKNAFLILSCYPFVFTGVVLVGGLLQSHNLTYIALGTLMLYIFFGSIAWFIILICLLVKKQASIKQIGFNILILSLGIAAAYYVFEYDVFSSGAKYMD